MSDKRSLTRQYKETPPTMGVYTIRNLDTGRRLVGASLNLPGAMNRDRFDLTHRSHRNKALQQDWTTQGGERFVFEVVDTLKPRDDPAWDAKGELAVALALWCEELQAFGESGYNRR